MRKIVLSLLIVHCSLFFAFAQTATIIFHKKDHTTLTYNLNQIQSIVFSQCTQSLTARDVVLKNYTDIYLATEMGDLGWTGNIASCNAGTLSQTAQDNTLKRLNYFRNLVGLPGIPAFDATLNAECQQGSLMCDANGAINHFPPSSWKCYTAAGYDATSHGNLAQGDAGPAAITGWIEDPGSANALCGHRRMLLYPAQKTMGNGGTCEYVPAALAYTGYGVIYTQAPWGSYPANMPAFIAYPPQGYVPAPLVFARWSFSIPNADFSGTSITMTDASGKNISLNVISNGTAGDPGIVWEPTGIITTSQQDQTYNVKVNNVSGSNYSYQVIVVQPNTPKKDNEVKVPFKVL